MFRLFRVIFRSGISIRKTVYVNFKMLPFSAARKLPIFVYRKWNVAELKGTIKIDAPIKLGMIKLGTTNEGYFKKSNGILRLLGGQIIFKGECIISNGCQIFVNNNGVLEFDQKSLMGYNARLICYKSIYIGKMSEITWESQVTDFGSHYIENMETGQIPTIVKPVHIGNYNWIGNRTTVMPGTRLPDRIIVASNSLLNKDYIAAGVESYSVIGGMPAKVLKKGMKRIYCKDTERFLHKYFAETDNTITTIKNIED